MLELIRAGLSARQKSLPSAFLYDELGSLLFEAITLLPEYEVARVDVALLERHVGDALSLLEFPLQLVELGPGHGKKARIVLDALSARQRSSTFVAIDVAASALDGCRRQLEPLEAVTVTCIEDTFIAGLARAPRPSAGRRLVLFLGSNLSNFDRVASRAFLSDVRASLQPGDALLLSADLEKPPARLLPAYDDALGVTAAFNKNLLARLNRELGANFDLSLFEHQARWVAPQRRIEMHLVAQRACEVQVPRLELTVRFEQGESIWTESSHRFDVAELEGWAQQANFTPAATWVNEHWPLALSLFVAR